LAEYYEMNPTDLSQKNANVKISIALRLRNPTICAVGAGGDDSNNKILATSTTTKRSQKNYQETSSTCFKIQNGLGTNNF
jgi:hypothetical protein